MIGHRLGWMECDPRADAQPLETRILVAIRRITRAIDLYSRRLVEEISLTGPQLAMLQQLVDRPSTPSQLARALHLSGATVTGILARLERRGLLERARGQTDRRTVQVTVTEAGRSVLAEAPSLLQDRFRQRLAGLATWEQLMMLASLQRIAAMMDAESVEAAPYLVADERAFEQDPLAAPAFPVPPPTAFATPAPPASSATSDARPRP